MKKTGNLVRRLAICCGVLAITTITAHAQQQPPPGGNSARPIGSQLQLSQSATTQIKAIIAEKRTWTPVQQKIDSNLLIAAKRQSGQALAPGFPVMQSAVKIDAAGKTMVDIRATVTPRLLDHIRALGGVIENAHPRFSAVRATIPVGQVQTLAADPDVRAIRPADELYINKIDTSEGDIAHRAAAARSMFSVDGTGIQVGVLSDSVDSLASLQSSGDLPATVTVLPGQSGNPGSSEGTAMLEIVHDLVPGSDLFFASAFGGQAQFAQNILDLQAAGCDVIVDDVGYFAEFAFQDGVIAQAVETVTAAGAVYFSSAGNSGNKNDGTSGVWEGDFNPSGSFPLGGGNGEAHDFGGGTIFNTITGGSPSVFTLQWSDPAGASGNDYDLYIMDAGMNNVVASSTSSQTGTQDPFEIIGGGSATGLHVLVLKFSGADRYLHVNTNRGRLAVNTARQTWGHAAAQSAFGVAAVNVSSANGAGGVFDGTESVETFSSDGPRRIFYFADGTPVTPGDVSSTGGVDRNKPDVAAADGVSTATPGFNPFFGTSAAAPHAAAVAALLRSKDPSLTPAGVRTILTTTALDIEAAGYDRDSGFGIVDAVAALSASGGCPPPTAVCQNIARSLVGSSVTVLSGEVDNGSTAGSGCTISSVEIRKTVGGVNGPSVTFDCTELGGQNVTLRVTQDDGQTDECTATVTVSDDTPPTVTCMDTTVMLSTSGQASITTADVFQSGSDNCGAVNQDSVNPNGFTCADLGGNVVTLSVSDASGNVNTCQSTVTVQDIDSDNDGTGDCADNCPNDPAKVDPGVCGCGVADTDTDNDGTPDCNDGCPNDANKTAPGQCGCGIADTDMDSDGVADCNDGCPNDPQKTSPGACGCGTPDTDTDMDGTPDCVDGCPNDPAKISPGVCGCGVADTDSDNDGTPDCNDMCPNDPNKTAPGQCGCGVADTDTDSDGIADCNDGCPTDPAKTSPGICGCGTPDIDTDTDGVPDCNDGCPTDPAKTAPGQCGCGIPDTDTDTDGVADCNDGCPTDSGKTDPGVCGCGVPDTDSDNDGTPDCNDNCPNDPNKINPGVCGCGVPDTDSDGDGVPDCIDQCPGAPDVDSDNDGVLDCNDGCPFDSMKIAPGECGCGVPDTDTDNDGTPDCNDMCPSDPNKIDPGQCGCGVPDTDADSDGVADCVDGCPNDPNKTAPGACGCGVPDTDSDNDGVADCVDGCPNDPNKTAPGQCGCGVADTDMDSDGVTDCNDGCPNDPAKTVPGICGCGTPDVDTDSDGVADCNDGCPTDPAKTAPGVCGCGVPDTDTDMDGTPDCNDMCPNDPAKTGPGQCGCGVPDTDMDSDGVADCNDGCPNDPGKITPGQCGCGVADTDTDADLVADCVDNCPTVANPSQTDSDGDGFGDACDQPGDLDHDGDVDLVDYAILADCLAGPNVPTPPAGCSAAQFADADLDVDNDVDLMDFAALMLVLP